MSFNWGPQHIVPTETLKTYSGHIQLRETLDGELLEKDLETLGMPLQVMRIVTPWYYRMKGEETWIKIGESDDRERHFAVSWDTTGLHNGQYEILTLMHVTVHGGEQPSTIARENMIEVTVEN